MTGSSKPAPRPAFQSLRWAVESTIVITGAGGLEHGAGVPCLIAGGAAVNAHGYGRLTQDLADISELRRLHGADPDA